MGSGRRSVNVVVLGAQTMAGHHLGIQIIGLVMLLVCTEAALTCRDNPLGLLVNKDCTPNITAARGGICIRQKLDLVFALDESSSIYPRQFRQQKEFVKEIIKGFEIGPSETRVGVLTFSRDARPRFNLKTFSKKTHVNKAIDYIRQRGGDTDTAEALRVLRTYSFDTYRGSRAGRGNVRQVGVIVTDGLSMNHDRTIREANMTKAKGIILITIGIGRKIKYTELEDIASRKDYVFAVDDFDELASLVGQIGPSACRAHHENSVIPSRPLAVGDSTLAASKEGEGCEEKLIDIFFALDVSVSYFDIRRLMGFVASLIYSWNVDKTRTRIGLLSYSRSVRIYFELGEKLGKYEALEALRKVERVQTYYKSDGEEALKAVKVHLFDTKFGGRKHAAKVIILITNEATNGNGTITQAKKLRKLGATIFAIGVGSKINRAELEGVVGIGAQQFLFKVPNYKVLGRIRAGVSKEVCKVEPAVHQQEAVCSKPAPVDLVFILDESSSIPHQSFIDEKQFIQAVVDMFDIGSTATRVGLISYSTNVTIQFYLDTFGVKGQIKDAVSDLQRKGGDTSTWEALRMLRQYGFRDGTGRRRKRRHGRKEEIGIVITDGQSQRPWETAQEALKAQKMGVVLFAVGIGQNISFDELKSIASRDEFVLTVDHFKDLQSIVKEIRLHLCKVSHHKLPPRIPDPKPNLSFKDYQKAVDLVFVMDTKNAGQMDTTKVAQFAKMIVENFYVGKEGLQVSVVPCGWKSIPSFQLNTYQTREEVIEKLDMATNQDLKTLLKKVADHSFSIHEGARPISMARRIAVVITDEYQIHTEDIITEVGRIKNQGVHIYVIGIGKLVRRKQLEMISGDPIGHYLIMLPAYKHLVADKSIYRHISHAVYKGLHDQPVISYRLR